MESVGMKIVRQRNRRQRVNMAVQFRITTAILVLVLQCAVADAQEKPRIFLGASSKTLGYSPLWVASRKGFFDQQGLDVQLVLLRGVPMTVQRWRRAPCTSAPAARSLTSKRPSAVSTSSLLAVSSTASPSF